MVEGVSFYRKKVSYISRHEAAAYQDAVARGSIVIMFQGNISDLRVARMDITDLLPA